MTALLATTGAPEPAAVQFDPPLSASSLACPSFHRFMHYSRIFYHQQRYTNGGPLVHQLERRLADWHGVRSCVATSSGFWTLVLAAQALAIPGRPEVVIPSLTYRRLADAMHLAGLVPHFCEVERDSLAATPATISPHLNDRTGLILGIHPIVGNCDAPGIVRLGQTAGVPVLFDSVESAFATVDGRRVGSFPDAECFSLHASKLLNGFEGGYVTTDNEQLAQQLREARAFGMWEYDQTNRLGTNAKMNEMHAAMALANLDEVGALLLHNRRIFDTYQQHLEGIAGLRLLQPEAGELDGFKAVVVALEPSWPLPMDVTQQQLHDHGVLSRTYYSPALHTKQYSYPVVAETLPVTESLQDRFSLLPCGSRVTRHQVLQVCALLRTMGAGHV